MRFHWICFCSPFLLTLTWQYSSWIASYCVVHIHFDIECDHKRESKQFLQQFYFCVPFYFSPTVCGIHWNCWNGIPLVRMMHNFAPQQKQKKKQQNHRLKWISLYEVNNRNWEFMHFWIVCVALWLPMNGFSNLFIRM